MADKVLSYIAPPTVKRFIDHRGHGYLQGPFGSGKSVGGCWKKFLTGRRVHAKHKLPRRTLIVRNTWETLKDTTLKSFREWFDDLGAWKDRDHTFTFPDTGHEFTFIGLDRPDHVSKVKSWDITDFLIDEASEIEQTIFLGLMGRLGRYPKIENKATCGIDLEAYGDCTSNPPDDEHWLVEEFDRDPKPGYAQFLQPSGLSPEAENLANLPAGYYEKLLTQYAARPDLIQRYVHGKRAIIVRGKAVYESEFSRALHVTNEKPKWPGTSVKILRGTDNSGNVPAAFAGWLNPGGVLEVVREFVTDRSGVTEFVGPMVEWCNQEFPGASYLDISDPAGHAEYSDPRGGMTSNAKIAKEKYGIEYQKGPTNFLARREALAERLLTLRGGQPAIRIYGPGCPRLVSALEGGYCYKQLPGGRGYSAEPEKNRYSHIAEALQYGCTAVRPRSEANDEASRLAVQAANRYRPLDGAVGF